MKDQGFKQSSLFPEVGTTIVEVQLGLHQESERIGGWVRVYRPPHKSPIYERTCWKNFSHNGFVNIVRELIDAMQETEEYHGLNLDDLEVPTKGVPF